MVSHIQNKILKKKNFTGSGLEGVSRRLNFFSRDYFYVKTTRHSKF